MRFRPIEDVSDESGESTSFPHLKELKNGDLAASAIKQVASGRFGVTPEYLVSAKQARNRDGGDTALTRHRKRNKTRDKKSSIYAHSTGLLLRFSAFIYLFLSLFLCVLCCGLGHWGVVHCRRRRPVV